MTRHLAVLREPYLSRILAGEKTIESRFLRVRAAPYGCVTAGDTLFLKRASGPIVATARAARVVMFDDLTPARVAALLERYAGGLRLDDDMRARAQSSRYAVLIWLTDVAPISDPPLVSKRDRRAWVVLES
ncbi:MAG: ASCH domain-containing protein [Roseiflexus sp.]|nr:ASCH domain-containing protein [Roseiflexus sp.]MCS7290874.1 ASCH domain-containing protein [Roseiflexus sp.]MDW8146299.1 ASCH domain-containing protein [Roseiflexaceae bacterium]MDW8232745.1 ASCH domain-containing protein [Roseiflexaceae bacterium]